MTSTMSSKKRYAIPCSPITHGLLLLESLSIFLNLIHTLSVSIVIVMKGFIILVVVDPPLTQQEGLNCCSKTSQAGDEHETRSEFRETKEESNIIEINTTTYE